MPFSAWGGLTGSWLNAISSGCAHGLRPDQQTDSGELPSQAWVQQGALVLQRKKSFKNLETPKTTPPLLLSVKYTCYNFLSAVTHPTLRAAPSTKPAALRLFCPSGTQTINSVHISTSRCCSKFFYDVIKADSRVPPLSSESQLGDR